MHIRLVRLSLLSLAMLLLQPSVVSARRFSIPHGFRQLDSAPGVRLFQRRRDFVQVVTPSEGGAIESVHGKFLEMGLVGSFPRRRVDEWWTIWHEATPGAFSIFNGQFFDFSDPDIAPLAFSMKAEGKVYEGYADRTEYPGKKLMLILGSDHHRIIPYSDNPVELVDRPESDIVVGLSSTAPKTAGRAIPRTFVGITSDGRTVILSSSMASQGYADRLLRSFGVETEQILMLDGGTSSHLVHEGKVLVPSTPSGKRKYARETLPHMLGVKSKRGSDE